MGYIKKIRKQQVFGFALRIELNANIRQLLALSYNVRRKYRIRSSCQRKDVKFCVGNF
jgi:hypothetical protein